jgi:hypothetical protein
MGSLVILCLVGCGVEGEYVDASGEVIGVVQQSLAGQRDSEANDGGDRAAGGRLCSTLCECGRIWHQCGWTINCDYWCPRAEDQESVPGCGSGGESEDGANESIDERDPESDDQGRIPARGPMPAGDERNDANHGDVRAADACYSICGDPRDGIICGPHACAVEAAGSCCPEDESQPHRDEEPEVRDQEEPAEDGPRARAGQDDQSDEPSPARSIRANLTADVAFNPRRKVCRVTLNAISTRNVFLRAPAPGASGFLLTRNADRVYRTRPTSYGWSRTFIVQPGSYTASLFPTDGRRVYRRALSHARIRCGVIALNPDAREVVGKARKKLLRNKGGFGAAKIFGVADE